MNNELFSLLKPGETEETQQLICFPYLGGYANAFLSLTQHFTKPIEIWALTPPGHGGSANPPLQDLASLVASCVQELKHIIKPNSVFFGHSMGAIVAYFIAQQLQVADNKAIKPRALILSACNSPAYFKEKHMSALSDQEIIDKLKQYGGIPSEIFLENSLIEYFLPAYRADFKILENSATHAYQPFTLPTYYFWGEKDIVVPFENVLQWRAYFSNDIHFISIKDAPHMFVDTHVSEVAKHIEHIFEDLKQPFLNAATE